MESPDAGRLQLKRKVLLYLDKEVGSDISGLKKVKELYQEFQTKKTMLEERLSLASNEAPSLLSTTLKEAEDAQKALCHLSCQWEPLKEETEEHLKLVEPHVLNLKKHLHDVPLLERTVAYLECVQRLQRLSSDIQVSLTSKEEQQAVDRFRELVDLCCCMQASRCRHLRRFVVDTTVFWQHLLKDQFGRELEEVLNSLNWPFLGMNRTVSTVAPSPESLQRFQSLLKLLLQLQLPEELNPHPAVTSTIMMELHSPLLPIQLMLRPLNKRFLFHFSGNRQTNNPAKPEWFFTQVLAWVRDHSAFLQERVQPVLDSLGLHSISAEVEFMRGLVQLLVEKLHRELPELQFDEALLSHTIDETIVFHRELQELGYPPSQPGVLGVLTQAASFVRWVAMEKKYALEKMDQMLSSETAWQQPEGYEQDELKVTECAENFVTLLATMTERYRYLPQPGHRLQFLELQLELLDDFRLRALQLGRGERQVPLGHSSHFCPILNTLHYLSAVLREWGEMPFFLAMQYYRAQYKSLHWEHMSALQQHQGDIRSPDDLSHFTAEEDWNGTVDTSGPACSTPLDRESRQKALDTLNQSSKGGGEAMDAQVEHLEGTVFDEVRSLLAHVQEDMLQTLAGHVMADVRSQSGAYRREKWFAMGSSKDFLQPVVTASACGLLQSLSSHIHLLREALCDALFTTTWQRLCDLLNEFLFYDLILPNHFNEGGAAQLNFDIFRNLFPIFGEFTRKPEAYFPHVKEACFLLTLAKAPAVLLLDTLQSEAERKDWEVDEPGNAREALVEMGVEHLLPGKAALVLQHRTDLGAS